MSEKIKVVLLEPGKLARAVEINASLAGMQKVVGGLIEPSTPLRNRSASYAMRKARSMGCARTAA